MPRLTTSKLGTVLAFFRSATMEIAEAGFDLARDIIRERKQTAEKIRQGQLKNKPQPAAAAIPAGVIPAATGTRKRKRGPKPGAKAAKAATAAAGPKKSHHKKKPAGQAPAAASERRRAPRARSTAAASEPVPETEANLPLDVADDFVPEPELEQV